MSDEQLYQVWLAAAEKVPKKKRRAFAVALHYLRQPVAEAREALGLSFEAAMGLIAITKTMPWRPSNGTGGDYFRAQFCDRCEKDRYESKPCGIFTRSLIYDIDDPKYPKEWIETIDVPWEDRNPRCTAFVEKGSVHRKPRKRAIVKDKRQEGLPL